MKEFKTVFRGLKKEEVLNEIRKMEKEIEAAAKIIQGKDELIEKLLIENESLKVQVEITKKIYEINKKKSGL